MPLDMLRYTYCHCHVEGCTILPVVNLSETQNNKTNTLMSRYLHTCDENVQTK